MKVVVSSKNPVKLSAARNAFEAVFDGSDIDIVAVSVESGVSEQPMSDDETRTGAENRVRNAKAAHPDADYWVGLEGGIEQIDDTLVASAWMAVLGQGNEPGMARTTSLPLPPRVRELVDAGMELGDANDRVFSTLNSKQGGGAFGLLTDGRYTRESVYTQAIIIALVPFTNPLYPNE